MWSDTQADKSYWAATGKIFHLDCLIWFPKDCNHILLRPVLQSWPGDYLGQSLFIHIPQSHVTTDFLHLTFSNAQTLNDWKRHASESRLKKGINCVTGQHPNLASCIQSRLHSLESGRRIAFESPRSALLYQYLRTNTPASNAALSFWSWIS